MPPAPEQITLVKDGQAKTVSIDQAGGLVRQGWKVESAGARVAREAGELKEERKPGLVASAGLAAARGLTLGSSDVLGNLLEGRGYQRYAKEAKEAHPIVSTGANIAGNVALLALTGGASAESTAGKVAQGALEGAHINEGNYISDVALGDRQLSAEGFVGAMGKGALWGGSGAAGALAAERGLIAARKLFPKGEVSAAATAEAEQAATAQIAAARRDSDTLSSAAHDRMRGIREEVGSDPRLRAEHEAVAANAASRLSAEANPQGALEQAVGAPTAVEQGAAKAGKAGGEAVAKEVAPEAEKETPDTLLAQLQRTKQKIDEGASLKQLSTRPTAIEDAVNEHVARTHPEMDRIVRANREMEGARQQVDEWLAGEGAAPAATTRKQAVKDWVARTKPSEAQYYTEVPEGEGTVGLPRGMQKTFRGGELDKALAELDVTSKFERGRTVAEKYLNPQRKGDRIAGAFDYGGRPTTAQDIIDASNAQLADRGMPPLDEQVKAAVRAKANPKFKDADVTKAIDALSRFEAAHGELTDALGPHAPPSAMPRAQAYRQAQQTAEGKTADAAARAAAATDKSPGLLSRAAHLAENSGQALEVLRALGVNVPDPRDVPVVGPLLSLYLKAKVGMRVLGKVGKSPEAAIAGKAATMRDAVQQAAAKAIDAARSGVSRTTPSIIATSTALGHALFESPSGKAQKATTLAEQFAARSAELAEAQRPGAIESAIQRRVGASDPEISDAIAETTKRKLAYLDQTRPKPATKEIAESAWTPDKQAMISWSRRVEAADHPASVFEQLARGQVPSHEALETVRMVYPRLWQEAQIHVASELAKGTTELPFAARVRLSVVYGVPIDGSMAPGFGAFLHQTSPPPPAPAPSPTLRADVSFGKATSNRVDR